MFLPDRVMAWSLSKHVKRSQLQNKNKKRTVFVIKHLRWATFRTTPMADDTQRAVCHQQLKIGACCDAAISTLYTVSVSCQSAGAGLGPATVILLLITEHSCTRDVTVVGKVSCERFSSSQAGTAITSQRPTPPLAFWLPTDLDNWPSCRKAFTLVYTRAKFVSECLKRQRYLGSLSVCGRRVIKWTVARCDVRKRSEFVWLESGPCAGCYTTG